MNDYQKTLQILDAAIPVWYEISLMPKSTGLIISIFNPAMTEITKFLTPNTPIIKRYESMLNNLPLFQCLPLFIPPTIDNWGFGEILRKVRDERSDWTSYQVDFPVMYRRDQTNFSYNAHISWQIVCTLDVLFMVLLYFVKTTTGDTANKQLLVIEGLDTAGGFNHCALWVYITPAMCRWLSTMPDNLHHEEIKKSMIEASLYMFEENLGINQHNFIALCRSPKWINLKVPGNACGLDPNDNGDFNNGRGYKLCPHNIDSRLQQFTFLAGLAKMHELARQNGF